MLPDTDSTHLCALIFPASIDPVHRPLDMCVWDTLTGIFDDNSALFNVVLYRSETVPYSVSVTMSGRCFGEDFTGPCEDFGLGPAALYVHRFLGVTRQQGCRADTIPKIQLSVTVDTRDSPDLQVSPCSTFSPESDRSPTPVYSLVVLASLCDIAYDVSASKGWVAARQLIVYRRYILLTHVLAAVSGLSAVVRPTTRVLPHIQTYRLLTIAHWVGDGPRAIGRRTRGARRREFWVNIIITFVLPLSPLQPSCISQPTTPPPPYRDAPARADHPDGGRSSRPA